MRKVKAVSPDDFAADLRQVDIPISGSVKQQALRQGPPRPRQPRKFREQAMEAASSDHRRLDHY